MPSAEPSPRPWRIAENSLGWKSCIEDADGKQIASCWGGDGVNCTEPAQSDAALIVDAVNERDRLRDVDGGEPIDPRVLRLCAVALELRECLAEECGGESGPFREILSIARDTVRAIVGEPMPGMGVVVQNEEGAAK